MFELMKRNRTTSSNDDLPSGGNYTIDVNTNAKEKTPSATKQEPMQKIRLLISIIMIMFAEIERL